MAGASGSNRPGLDAFSFNEEAEKAFDKSFEEEPAAEVTPATPAEPAKAEAATTEAEPVVAEPEAEPEAEPAAEPEPETPDTNEVMERVFAELDQIRAKLEPAKKAEPEKVPDAIQAALDHEDPTVQNLGKFALEQFNAQQAQIVALQSGVEQQQIERAAETIEPLINAAAEKYELTDADVDKVVAYLTADPDRARILTFEEGVQRVFPGRSPKAQKPKPSPTPPNPKTPAPGTVLAAGAAAAPPPTKPGPKKYASIDEFMDDNALKILGR